MLTIGQLSRFFKGTSIGYFEDLDYRELGRWVETMNELQRLENEAQRRAMGGG